MEKKTIFVNPVHGNEPYILGTLIAMQVGKGLAERGYEPRIVIPNIYGERQEKILSRHGLDETCVLDPALGEFYHNLLFSKGDFSQYLTDILEKREVVEAAIRRYLRRVHGTVDIEISAGSKVAGEGPVYYVFPVVYGELLQRSAQEPELAASFGKAKLERCAEQMQSVDSKYQKTFIPSYHTFSFDETREPWFQEVPTPPLKPVPAEDTQEIPEGAVFCMLSGTESEIETILERARTLKQEGIPVIISDFGVETDEFPSAPTSVISNKNIAKVIARAGWGTIWTCQQAGVDFEPLPYSPGDDPEIYFNVKTLQKIPIQEATREQRATFGPDMDGISFVADNIMADL